MSSKLNWDRLNSEKRALTAGTQSASIGMRSPLPLSFDDLLIDFDPDGDRRAYLKFLTRVVEDEILEREPTPVPHKLERFIQPLIEHYGGTFQWARRTRDYEAVRLSIVRKRADANDRIKRQFLHRVAKQEATGKPACDQLKTPDELQNDVSHFDTLEAWAHSCPEYPGILKSARNFAKRHWRESSHSARKEA